VYVMDKNEDKSESEQKGQQQGFPKWFWWHQVNVIKEVNYNLIGIDFNRRHQLIYNVINWLVKFARALANSILAIKKTVLPAMTSTEI
jgi:hypothetical protein